MSKISKHYMEVDNKLSKVYLTHIGVSSCQLIFRRFKEVEDKDIIGTYRSKVISISSFSRLLSGGGSIVLYSESGDSKVTLRISLTGGIKVIKVSVGGVVYDILRIELL